MPSDKVRDRSPFAWASVASAVAMATLILWYHAVRYARYAAAGGGRVAKASLASEPFDFNVLVWLAVGAVLAGIGCALAALIRQERHTGTAVLGVVLTFVAPFTALAISDALLRIDSD